jgi:hypothetical protein
LIVKKLQFELFLNKRLFPSIFSGFYRPGALATSLGKSQDKPPVEFRQG